MDLLLRIVGALCLVGSGSLLTAIIFGLGMSRLAERFDQPPIDEEDEPLTPEEEYLAWLESTWHHPSSRVPRVYPRETQ